MSTLHSSVLIKILPRLEYIQLFSLAAQLRAQRLDTAVQFEKKSRICFAEVNKKIWGVLTLLFCSSENIYSVREKEEGDMFFKAVHFYGSLHINQAPLLFRHSEVAGDPHIQQQNFMTFHYPRGEFFGTGKQPKIPCIHFYLTFCALLDQRPSSDSLVPFSMRRPINSIL